MKKIWEVILLVKHWADTSALLHQDILFDHQVKVAISSITLQELEHIKTSDKESEQVKFRAREIVRSIITSNQFEVIMTDNNKIDKMLKKYSYLSNINDHRILCAAELYAIEAGENIVFMTSDALQYLFALKMPHLEATYPLNSNEGTQVKEWSGWNDYHPNENQMALLYADPKVNTLKCKTNEFAKIYEGQELKDVLFWNGSEYRRLKYKDITNPYIDETIRPRNLEQKMAMQLLQDDNIHIKLLTSAWGGGKTLLSLSYALENIYNGKYAKLIFIRNNIIVADTNDIGYLPGDLRDKMSIWGAPLADHLGGQEFLDNLIDKDIIEIFPLSHIRGRSLHNAIVLCDECENMNDKQVTLLMSRIEDDSQLILCGDVAQIDNHKFEKNNGIRSMLKHLAGQPLFGTVKLIKSERGGVPKLCDLMRPPV